LSGGTEFFGGQRGKHSWGNGGVVRWGGGVVVLYYQGDDVLENLEGRGLLRCLCGLVVGVRSDWR